MSNFSISSLASGSEEEAAGVEALLCSDGVLFAGVSVEDMTGDGGGEDESPVLQTDELQWRGT